MRKIAASLLALSVLASSVSSAGASPAPRTLPDLNKAYPGESYTQYRRYHGGPRYYAPRYYGPRYYRRDNSGAVAAGVLGLAAGALVAGAIANQAAAAPAAPPPPATVDPQLAAYCAQRYRSFDPVTGTYLAYNGQRLVCTY